MLSAGEQQRVSIAAVMSGRPQIFILDEPTLAMTQRDLDVLLALIAVWTEQGRLVITITHDLDLVRESDRVVVLAEGAVLADDAPGVLLTEDFVSAIFTG